MDALERLEREKPLEPQTTSAGQNDQICRMAMEKIRRNAAPKTDKTIRLPEQNVRAQKRIKQRPWRTGLIAAALFCVFAVSVCAAGAALLPMLEEKIGFFQQAPNQDQVQDAVQAPRGEHEGQSMLESFNTPVGQTVTDNGITITLDNVSMDAAGIDLFFTVEGKEAMDELLAQNDYMPTWTVLSNATHFHEGTLNGQTMAWSEDANDWYQEEDGSLKLLVHILLPQLPEGDELTLQVKADSMLKRQGNWNFTVLLDGNSVRAGSKIGNAGVYSMPATPAAGDIPEINRDLNVDYFAFGPRGGVMAVRTKCWDFPDNTDSPLYSWYDGSTPSQFMMVDDTGKTLFAGTEASYFKMDDDISYFAADLTLPDPAATAITLTPMKEIEDECSTFTTEELKQGVKVPCGPESGFYIKNFKQQGSSFTWQEVPYGYNPRWHDLLPENEERISRIEGRSALVTGVRDPHTGVFNCRLDYYVASPEELESISEWRIIRPIYQPDHEHAFDIPLKAMDNIQ